MRIEALVNWLVPPVSGCIKTTCDVPIVTPLASIDIESFVSHHERCHRPVELHPTVVCSPVFAVEYCAVDSHWLIVGVGDANGLVVLENTDRNVIHNESVHNENMSLKKEGENENVTTLELYPVF